MDGLEFLVAGELIAIAIPLTFTGFLAYNSRESLSKYFEKTNQALRERIASLYK